jgi:hypothetical protein
MFKVHLKSNKIWYVLNDEFATRDEAKAEISKRQLAAHANWTFPPKMKVVEVS